MTAEDQFLTAVWRTDDRLHTDGATIAQLCEVASNDSVIATVVADLQPDEPGNGSVWASGTARADGTPVLLKLGARPAERAWMAAMDAAATNVVPRVFGSGEMRGVGWLVIEQCNARLDKTSSTDAAAVIETAARYQQAAATISAGTAVMDLRWVRENLDDARAASCPGDVDRGLADADGACDFVTSQCGRTANHGDVHFGNTVARTPDGPALLIDPMPITTVWAYDAAYLEVVSGHPGMVHEMARARQALGLPTADGLERVERILLGWVAALWWRIAPWRHERPAWRRYVETCVDGLRW